MQKSNRILTGSGAIDFNVKLPKCGLIQITGTSERKDIALFLSNGKKITKKENIIRVTEAKQWKYNKLSLLDLLLDNDIDEGISLLIKNLKLNMSIKYETMSTGETIIFNFIFAILQDKELIVLYEVFNYLDAERRKVLFDYLKNVNDRLIMICEKDEVAYGWGTIIQVNKNKIKVKNSSQNLIENTTQRKERKNKTTAVLNKFQRLLLFIFTLIPCLLFSFTFGEPFNNFMEEIENNRVSESSGQMFNKNVCWDDDDACHFETHLSYGGTIIDFVINEKRKGYFPSTLLKLFPNDGNQFENVKEFFKKYLDLDFKGIESRNEYGSEEKTIYVSKEEIKYIQTKVTKEGIYLIGDLEEILAQNSEINYFDDFEKSNVLNDENAMIINKSSYPKKTNVFTCYGYIKDKEEMKIAHVKADALAQFQKRGGFTYVKGLNEYEAMVSLRVYHYLSNPFMYREELPQIDDAFIKFLAMMVISLTTVLSLSLLSAFILIRTRSITIKNKYEFMFVSKRKTALKLVIFNHGLMAISALLFSLMLNILLKSSGMLFAMLLSLYGITMVGQCIYAGLMSALRKS